MKKASKVKSISKPEPKKLAAKKTSNNIAMQEDDAPEETGDRPEHKPVNG